MDKQECLVDYTQRMDKLLADKDAQIKELTEGLQEAVRIGKYQAEEWDRFWVAMDCLGSEISVDMAIKKYQELQSSLSEATNALEKWRKFFLAWGESGDIQVRGLPAQIEIGNCIEITKKVLGEVLVPKTGEKTHDN
jgi:hypothetical protein